MELRIRKNQDIYIIDVQGELDLYNSYKLKELLTKMLEKKIERFIIKWRRLNTLTPAVSGLLFI
jgi:anti-sigma B factor antagonist